MKMTAQLDDDKLRNVKTEVYCTLISTKDGLTVKDFLRDYRETVGKYFPHAAFGFKTALDFLRTIPDVVTIVNQIGGPELLVPVQTEKSAHINRLILEQKKTKKAFRRPRPIQLPTDSKTPGPLPSRTLLPLPKEPPISLRGWEKSTNASQFSNYTTQNNARYHWYGQQTMSMTAYNNYGPPSLMEINPLNTPFMSHYENRSFHVSLPSYRNASQKVSPQLSPYQYQDQNVPMASPLKAEPYQKQSNPVNQNVIENREIEDKPTDQKCLLLDEKINEKARENSVTEDEHNPEEMANEIYFKDNIIYNDEIEDDSSYSSCHISDKMKINFRTILTEQPGIKTSKLPSAYQERFGVPLNHNDLGFLSVKELVVACPDVFKVQIKKNKKDWNLYDSSSSLISSDDSSNWIPKQVLENMEQLSLMFPQGLKDEFILTAYKDMFKVALDFKKLGFESLTSFLVNCQSIECKLENENCFIFPIEWGHKPEVPSELEDCIPEVFLSLENVNFLWKKYFSDNVCDPTFKFGKFILPNSDTLKVLVSDALSPDVIWLQNASSGHLLNDLMFELNNFYDEEEENYKLTENMLIPGLACCVKFNPVNRWHRAILYPPSGNEAKVLYVDYGTTALVQIQDLRTLHKKFSDLPIQAIKSKLHNVKPVNQNGWSEESLEYLFSLCLNQIFVAEIISVKPEIPFIEVILCDTSGPEDVIINEALIAHNYALPSIQNPSTTASTLVSPSLKELNCPFMSYPECFLSLFPSWLSISEDWTEVIHMLDQAKTSYMNDASLGKTYDKNSCVPPCCCIHHLIAHIFINKPKFFCDVWNKTIQPFSAAIEKQLIRNLSTEMATPFNLKNSKRSCYLHDNECDNNEENIFVEARNGPSIENNLHFDVHGNINKENVPASKTEKECLWSPQGATQNAMQQKPAQQQELSTAQQQPAQYRQHTSQHQRTLRLKSAVTLPDPKPNDHQQKIEPTEALPELNHSPEGACNQLNSHSSDDSVAKSPPDREVKRWVVKADIGNKSLNCFRLKNQVYILMQEMLMTFARSVPTVLAQHRLDGSEINRDSIQITPEIPFYNILLQNNIVEKGETALMVPLSIAGEILSRIDPTQTSVSDILKEMAKTIDANHPYWFE